MDTSETACDTSQAKKRLLSETTLTDSTDAVCAQTSDTVAAVSSSVDLTESSKPKKTYYTLAEMRRVKRLRSKARRRAEYESMTAEQRAELTKRRALERTVALRREQLLIQTLDLSAKESADLIRICFDLSFLRADSSVPIAKGTANVKGTFAMKSVAKQLCYAYGVNRRTDTPVHMCAFGMQQSLKDNFAKRGMDSWKFAMHFATDEIVPDEKDEKSETHCVDHSTEDGDLSSCKKEEDSGDTMVVDMVSSSSSVVESTTITKAKAKPRANWSDIKLTDDSAILSQVPALSSASRVLYMSPDSDSPLQWSDVGNGTAFVIGGIVDRTVQKGLSLARALTLKVESRALPLELVPRWKAHSSLNIDTVTKIIIDLNAKHIEFEKQKQMTEEKKDDCESTVELVAASSSDRIGTELTPSDMAEIIAKHLPRRKLESADGMPQKKRRKRGSRKRKA